jgi:8-oxo-dGTP pyrophosphatase MutT (NUDIX family)
VSFPERVARRVPSDYVLRLREKVGHDLIVMPSVTVLLFDDDNRVLLVRHSDRGVWVAPGGMVEPDEDPYVTALREMREETGLDVDIVSILGVFGGPEFRVTYQNGDRVGYVMTVYEARLRDGEAIPDGVETSDIGFFSKQDIARLETAEWLPVVLAGFDW